MTIIMMLRSGMLNKGHHLLVISGWSGIGQSWKNPEPGQLIRHSEKYYNIKVSVKDCLI